MKIEKFEDIIAWQKAIKLGVSIYSNFKNSSDYSFKNQICSATISISNNIAEGFERESKVDFKRFLNYSISSCSEVKSMLYLAEPLEYISKEEFEILRNKCIEISKILRGLIYSLKKKP